MSTSELGLKPVFPAKIFATEKSNFYNCSFAPSCSGRSDKSWTFPTVRKAERISPVAKECKNIIFSQFFLRKPNNKNRVENGLESYIPKFGVCHCRLYAGKFKNSKAKVISVIPASTKLFLPQAFLKEQPVAGKFLTKLYRFNAVLRCLDSSDRQSSPDVAIYCIYYRLYSREKIV